MPHFRKNGNAKPCPVSGKAAPSLSLALERRCWPVRERFTIADGSRTEIHTIVATLHGEGATGRGESVPYARFGETPEQVQALLVRMCPALEAGAVARGNLSKWLPAGAARNALDCALWDWEAKRQGFPVWRLAGLSEPGRVRTAFTLSMEDPDSMARKAARAEREGHDLLKLKLGQGDDLARLKAVRQAAPRARLIVDANGGWDAAGYARLAPQMKALGVALVEQPLAEGQDDALATLPHPVPLCADESCRDRASLPRLSGRYESVNIKLDKAGGLTEALALKREALALGLSVMVGSMLAPSLALAPAFLLTQGAICVDLDGPLLLAKDRDHPLRYDGNRVDPPARALWG